jgi:branched-chain amino acid transport system permease protein
MYFILAMGLRLVVDCAGLLDLGYIAFFGIGAYFYAIADKLIAIPFIVAVVVGALLAAALAILRGIPALRVRGDYLALVTLSFGEVFRQVLISSEATGGPSGISDIRMPAIGVWHAAEPAQYYLITIAGVVLSLVLFKRMSASPVFHIWRAIRDDETAARTCGLSVTKWLSLAFAMGAAFAGASGVLFAATQRAVSPASFGISESVLILSIVVLAQGRSLGALLLSTIALVGLPEALRFTREFRPLFFGGFLILIPVCRHRFSAGRATWFISRFRYGGRWAGYLLEEFSGLSAATPKRSAENAVRCGEQIELDALTMGPRTESRRSPPVGFEAIGVVKRFGRRCALDALYLEAKNTQGKIIAIVGPNGSGKTTFLNCLSALARIDEGLLETQLPDGHRQWTAHRLAAAGVGRTFQQVRLFGTMTLGENVEIGAYCGLPISIPSALWGGGGSAFRKQASARATAALASVGVVEQRHLIAKDAPMGLARKTEIARALAMEPRILLLDEIAAGLDEREKIEMSRLLRNLARTRMTVIVLVEHDVRFVVRLADRIVVLAEGRTLVEGDPHSVMSDKRVQEVYLGQADSE